MLSFLTVFIFLRVYILYKCFRFSYMPLYFYVPLFLLGALRFLHTLFVFTFLQALRWFICFFQMPNKGGKGNIDLFFIFTDPYRGH